MTIHSTFGKLAVSLALAGTFLLPGLDARAADDTLNFVNYRDVRDLNPHLYAGEMYAQEMLFETLVDITADGYKPCLAESWDISADGKVYTFHIRKGVTFTDGTPCDAFAVKANFDAILENRARHTWLEMMHLLEKVDAPRCPYVPHLHEGSVLAHAYGTGRDPSLCHHLAQGHEERIHQERCDGLCGNRALQADQGRHGRIRRFRGQRDLLGRTAQDQACGGQGHP